MLTSFWRGLLLVYVTKVFGDTSISVDVVLVRAFLLSQFKATDYDIIKHINFKNLNDMKRLLLTLLTLVSLTTFAQDIIICRNGDEISSKVLKVSKTEVEYKKWTNQDGPAYTIEKAEVFMIKYQNGDKDVFKETPAAQPTTTEQQTVQAEEQTPNEPIMATPAANNAELIAAYNNEVHEYFLKYPEKNKVKKTDRYISILGITASSILSTNDIEISLIQANKEDSYWYIYGQSIGETIKPNVEPYIGGNYLPKYAIIIKNKTSRVVYIDKAACFGTSSTGKTKKYYDHTEYTVTEGGNSGSGASVNLGSVADALGVGGAVGTLASGVNVGGDKGKFSATTTTYKNDRVLTIPPQSSVALSKDGYRKHPTNKKEYIITGSYEYADLPELSLNVDEIKQFSEDNTPSNIVNYMITYSFDKELKNCFMVNFGVYVKEVFGIKYNFPYYSDKGLKSKTPKTIVAEIWPIY